MELLMKFALRVFFTGEGIKYEGDGNISFYLI